MLSSLASRARDVVRELPPSVMMLFALATLVWGIVHSIDLSEHVTPSGVDIKMEIVIRHRLPRWFRRD